MASQGVIVYAAPFAEEMNKSRRAVALQARALALSGYAVLQMDALGCGDSSGDFGDASWEAWVEDLRLACAWVRTEFGGAPWLWGLRTGCLLAAATAAVEVDIARLLLWQPVASGKQYFQQFLRLKAAGELLGGNAKEIMDGLKARLSEGHAIEIAGYTVSAALANGLAAAELSLPPRPMRVDWLEVSGKPDAIPSPAATSRAAQWQHEGHAVAVRVAHGPAFWQTVEIAECPALVAATLAAVTPSSEP